MIIDSPLTSLLHVSQALQAQTPQAEQEKAWADWVAEREEAGEVAAQAYAWRAWRQRWPLRLVACEEGEVL